MEGCLDKDIRHNLAKVFGFYILLLCIITAAEICGPKTTCKNKPTTTSEFPVQFVYNPPGKLNLGCPGSTKRLHCCMKDFTRIEWFEFSTARNQWIKFKNNNERYLCEDDQTLKIEAVQGAYFTNYSCVGYGGNSGTIVNNITLQKLDCERKLKSTFILPHGNVTIKSLTLGKSHDIYCMAQFGQNQCGFGCRLFWMRRKESDIDPINMINGKPNTTDRIKYHVTTDRDNVSISRLHIEEIQEDDYKWTYICGGNSLDGMRYVVLRTAVSDVTPKVPMAIVVSLSVFIVIFFIFTLLGYIYNVEMRVFYKTKIKRKTFRQIADAQHQIFLMYSPDEEDTDFGRSVLTSYLKEELGYNVFNTDQTSFGQSVFNSFSNAMETSSVMIVVVSESLMDIEECKVCVRDAINTGHKTIFVIREELKNLNDENRDMMVAIRAGHTVMWYQDGEADQHSCCENRNVQMCRNKLHLKVLSMLEKM